MSLSLSRPMGLPSSAGLLLSMAAFLSACLARLWDTACSMIWSSSARWQRWPSASWMLGALFPRQDGMGIGELIFLGGEDEGERELNEALRRPSRPVFSWGVLIQLTPVSGMLFCLTGTACLCGMVRGGGGRGGGEREEFFSLFKPLFLVCSVLVARWRMLWGLVWLLPLVEVLLLCESAQVSPGAAKVTVSVDAGLEQCVCWKRGLMKHRAPFDWLHSRWEGVRVRGTGVKLSPGDSLFSTCFTLCWTANPSVTELSFWHSLESQNPEGNKES